MRSKNRISIDKALVERLEQEGEKYLFDLAGIVNHILRLYLAGELSRSDRASEMRQSISKLAPEEKAIAEDREDVLDLDIDLGA